MKDSGAISLSTWHKKKEQPTATPKVLGAGVEAPRLKVASWRGYHKIEAQTVRSSNKL